VFHIIGQNQHMFIYSSKYNKRGDV